MIAIRRQSRKVEDVCRRIELARALKIADPGMTAAAIAAELGTSRASVYLYLQRGTKCFRTRPPWAEKFFAAAGLLCYGDNTGAARILREIAGELEKAP